MIRFAAGLIIGLTIASAGAEQDWLLLKDAFDHWQTIAVEKDKLGNLYIKCAP